MPKKLSLHGIRHKGLKPFCFNSETSSDSKPLSPNGLDVAFADPPLQDIQRVLTELTEKKQGEEHVKPTKSSPKPVSRLQPSVTPYWLAITPIFELEC